MNANHPLSRLTAAESTLIASIDAATSSLNAVGTSSLDSALERLHVAAHAATARLTAAGAIVASLAGDVLENVLGVAMGIAEAMGRESMPPETGITVSEPAQVQPAIGYTFVEPTVEPAIIHEPPSPDVLAKLPFLFAGQRPPEVEPEPAPRRTGFPMVDAFLDVARETEAITAKEVSPTDTPRERYPAAPAFTPDGPTLFDEAGNAADPTEVLAKPHAVPYAPGVPLAASGSNGDGGAIHAVASPQRKRKGR